MKLYTVAQVAQLAHTSVPTVRLWIKEEKLAVTRLGTRIFIEEEWLKEFMLTPENALTYDHCIELGVSEELTKALLACQDREREALARGATQLSEVEPPPKEAVVEENQGVFRKRSGDA